jgi:hypothetical protein
MNVSALISSLYVTVIAGQELEANSGASRTPYSWSILPKNTFCPRGEAQKPGVEFLARLKVNYARANLTKLKPRYSSRAEAGGPL